MIDIELHPRQSDCFLSEANEILYGGSAGGGKSHAMRVIALYYAIHVPNIQIYLFRRLSEDLKKNHLDGSSGFVALLTELLIRKKVSINFATGVIQFWNGAKIHLCHCQHEKDVVKYQGVEINLLLIDELTHFSEYIYKFLRGRVRIGGLKKPTGLVGSVPRIICGSNPGGIGHVFVKQSFIDILKPFEIKQMPDEEGGMLRQYIPARLEDNPTMMENDPLYKNKLLGLGGALAKAMLEGDWDAIEGAYFDTFDKNKHILPRFDIPADWYKIRGFDWGYSKPFAVLWGAISDGSLVNIGGKNISLPRGSLIIYKEYYGWTGKANEGAKLHPKELARETRKAQGHEKMNDQVADPAIFDVSTGESIAEMMAQEAVKYRPADNKRVAGWQQIRTRLIGSDGKPMLYIVEDCKSLIRTLPAMQYDKTKPEDLDTNMEDHLVDTLRYICMARPVTIDIKEQTLSPQEDFWLNFNPAQLRRNRENLNKSNYE